MKENDNVCKKTNIQDDVFDFRYEWIACHVVTNHLYMYMILILCFNARVIGRHIYQ